ncbi:HD domain-containing protein [Mycolicibacterium baixiangningiae]|uniref:HD domain-containing protein n=1 Tax=Mycolicibacterium baixiangningiae TaxID=2761578 RepID=UPI0018D191A6|nr:HD domain-containing protein [Mycolicibacterium baixiangningiae]
MTLPQEVDLSQWDLPDDDVCSAALQLVMDVSPAVIANHTVRSYLFARELAAAKGLRGGTDYDDELVFLTCLLHDLGVTEHGDGDQRFEVDGADAAVRFLLERGVAEDRTRTVWEGIALHTSLGLADRFGAEQAVSFFGISLDIDGAEKTLVSADFLERVHAAWPRHDFGYAIADLIAQGTAANPLKAPPFTFPAHLHRLLNGSSITFPDVLENSGWGDQPVDR